MERPASHRWSSQEVAKIVALFDAERRFHEQMVTLLPVALATVGADGRLLAANSAFLKQFQIAASEIESQSLAGLFQQNAAEVLQTHQATAFEAAAGTLHFTPLPRWERGETEWMMVVVAGAAVVAPVSLDVSSSGAQVLATQRLAQTVTHEANNLVMIAAGYGKEILAQLPGDSPIREDVSMLLDATKRIEAMTALLAEYGKPRRSTIAAHALSAVAPGASDAVSVDMAALQSAIAAANALAGGQMKIEALRQPPHMVLVLTGFSMTAEALRQALEPLSKAAREGDAVARGAALIGPLLLQAGVQWRVTSAAALEIQVPLAVAASVAKRSALVTDDQPGIRKLVRRVLEGMGFAVDEVGSGEEAIALLERRGEAVTLLVTDMQMDGMTGRDLADRVRYHYPSTRILFISGYTDDPGVQSGTLQDGTAFLEKPFDPGQLKAAVAGLME